MEGVEIMGGPSILDPLGIFPKKPKITAAPTRADPSVVEARERQRLSALKRRGRASTILTESEDQLGATPVARPQAGT